VIKDTIEVNFNITPCKFQLQCAQAQLDHKDVITIAPMRAGKTLMFWNPLLFNHDGIVVLITALNGLGDQNITVTVHLPPIHFLYPYPLYYIMTTCYRHR
jgi:hypothetical protein